MTPADKLKALAQQLNEIAFECGKNNKQAIAHRLQTLALDVDRCANQYNRNANEFAVGDKVVAHYRQYGSGLTFKGEVVGKEVREGQTMYVVKPSVGYRRRFAPTQLTLQYN